MTRRNKHIGLTLDTFLKEEGVFKESRAIAITNADTWQVQQAMAKKASDTVEGTENACSSGLSKHHEIRAKRRM